MQQTHARRYGHNCRHEHILSTLEHSYCVFEAWRVVVAIVRESDARRRKSVVWSAKAWVMRHNRKLNISVVYTCVCHIYLIL